MKMMDEADRRATEAFQADIALEFDDLSKAAWDNRSERPYLSEALFDGCRILFREHLEIKDALLSGVLPF